VKIQAQARAALLAALLAWSALAGAAEIANVRVWSGPESTRVVFELNGPVDHRVFALTDPNRIVVDLPSTSARGSLSLPEPRGVVDAVRTGERQGGALRLVLELNRAATPKAFLLAPGDQQGYRLVIDLLPPDAAVAAGSAPAPARETPPPVIAAAAPTPVRAAPAPVSAASTSVRPAPAPGAGRGRDVVIAIDAGHGGEDPGASGRNGAREKDVVLAIARRLAAEVDAQPGMRAVLTRKGDYFVTHRKRMEIAHGASADFFISIHADSYRDSAAKGSTVYVLSEKGASDEASLLLAQRENASDLIGGVSLADKDQLLARVLLDLSQNAALSASTAAGQRLIKRMSAVGTMRRVQVQQAPFLVLKSPDIPSVLVETAYISNPREEAALRSPQHQTALAKALRDGIVDYFTANPPQGSYFAVNTVERPAQTVRHVIARGETLSEIAERYRVSTAVLRRSNSLKSDQVRIGQVLTIPPPG
jgi:N-acetylmuramoyl-L-alanine amidase